MYRKYVTVENEKKVLYAELEKVLYGILRGALLFWEKVTSQLIEWGFEVNPYDWCVAKKWVECELEDEDEDGNPEKVWAKLTIGWHVEDFIVINRSQKVVDDFI